MATKIGKGYTPIRNGKSNINVSNQGYTPIRTNAKRKKEVENNSFMDAVNLRKTELNAAMRSSHNRGDTQKYAQQKAELELLNGIKSRADYEIALYKNSFAGKTWEEIEAEKTKLNRNMRGYRTTNDKENLNKTIQQIEALKSITADISTRINEYNINSINIADREIVKTAAEKVSKNKLDDLTAVENFTLEKISKEIENKYGKGALAQYTGKEEISGLDALWWLTGAYQFTGSQSQLLYEGKKAEKAKRKKLEYAVLSSKDLNEKAELGKNYSSPKQETIDLVGNKKGAFFGDFIDDYDLSDKKREQSFLNNVKEGKDIYKYMTSEEKSVYYYFLGDNKVEAANNYILSLKSDLESRKAHNEAKNNNFIENLGDAIGTGYMIGSANIGRLPSAIKATSNQSLSELDKRIFNTTYDEKLWSEIQANSSNRSAIGNIMLEVTNSVASQVPAMIVGSATGQIGYFVAMSANIIGGSTTEAINSGYEAQQGFIHGIVDSVLEIGVEKALGGFSSLLKGGSSNSLVKSAIGSVDKAVKNKFVANLLAGTITKLGQGGAEGVEEFLQELTNPLIRNIIYGESNEYTVDTFKDAIHAFAVGALSGIFMSLPYIKGSVSKTRAEITGDTIKAIDAAGGVKSVLALAEVAGNNSELYRSVKEKVHKGIEVDSLEVGYLYQESFNKFKNPNPEMEKAFVERNIDAVIAEANKIHSTANDATAKNAEYKTTTVNSKILNLIKKVKSGIFKANDKEFLDGPTEDVVKQITKITGIDVSGFKVAVEARQIEHILKDHGENGAADHSMSDDLDIAKMEYALNSPDSIVLSGTTQAYVTSVNGKNKPAKTVLYEKSLSNNSYYVVQAVPDTKAKTLYIVSAFIGKEGYKKETSQTADAKSPSATPNSENASVSSDITVPQKEQSVNNNIPKRALDMSEELQTSPLQSSENGGIINNNDSIANGGISDGRLFNQRGNNENSPKFSALNAGGTEESARFTEEDSVSFEARIERTFGEKRKRLVTGNTVLSYVEGLPNNSEAGIAYYALKSIGIKVVFCQGPIYRNNGKITTATNQAVTSPDGTIYVSSNASLPGVEIAYHELVHAAQNTNNEAFVEYESELCQNIDLTSSSYRNIAKAINDNNFGGKFDIDDIDYFMAILKELSAYINQFVATDVEYARQTFGGMFKDWSAVVSAVEKFNNDMGADFSESASIMSENEAQGDFEGETGKDTAANENKPRSQAERSLQAILDVAVGKNSASQTSPLQSGENGGIINQDENVTGDDNIVDKGTVAPSVEEIREKYFTKKDVGRDIPETAETFAERTRRTGVKEGGRKRTLLTNGKSSMAYTVSNSDTPLNRFVQKLRAIGIDAYCCEDAIETNIDGVTTIHTEAITTSKGKIFFCESSLLTNKEKIDHELVHHSWRQFSEAYFDYENIIITNLNRESNYFIAFCEELNEREFRNKYDIDSLEDAAHFHAELTAYVYQNVLNDRAFAEEFFSNMFDNWEAVVDAVKAFNSKMEIDTSELIQVGSSESASIMPENEAQGDFEGETGKDTAANENKPRSQAERSLQAILDVAVGKNSALQTSPLQSGENGGIINKNETGGEDNVVERAVGTEGTLDEGAKNQIQEENASIARYVSRGEAEILSSTAGANGKKRRIRVNYAKNNVTFIEGMPEDTPGYRAYNAFKNAGINAIYCEGEIVRNINGEDIVRTDAFTAPDGTVYISSLCKFTEKETFDHERVHVAERNNTEEYTEYYDLLIETADFTSAAYGELADTINKGHFGGEYDIEDIETVPIFMSEISAYVNQYALSDPEYAQELFGGMFRDWGSVISAVEKFNKDVKADFSESASIMPENEAQGDFEGETGKDTAANENKPRSQAGRSLQAMLDVATGNGEDNAPKGEKLKKEIKRYSPKTEGQKEAKRVGEALGVKVVFEDTVKTRGSYKNGYIDEDGVIHIDINEQQPAKFVLVHELCHYCEETGQYGKFTKALRKSKLYIEWLRQVTKMENATLERMEARYCNAVIEQRGWAKTQNAVTRAKREMIADFCGEKIFGAKDTTDMQALLDGLSDTERRSIKQIMFDFFERVWAKLTKNNEKLENFDLARLERLYSKMFNEAKNNPTQKGEVRDSFGDTDSGMANDSLLPYDDELKMLISEKGDYIVDSHEKLIEVVNTAFNEPNKKATAYFGIIPTEILSKIEKSIPNIPKEFKGTLFKQNKTYSVAATLDSIQHLADNKKLSRSDIVDYLDRMADTIIDFDTVNFDYYYQGSQRSKGIIFRKTFDDGVIQSFEIVSNNKRTLNLQTIYMESGDYQKKKSAEALLMEKPSADAQGAGRSDFNNIIRKSDETVKPKSTEGIKDSITVDLDTEETSNENFRETIYELSERYKNGEVSRREFMNIVDEVYSRAEEQHGTIRQGESVTGEENFDNPVPKRVNRGRNVGQFARTIIEGGELTDEMITVTKQQILSGDLSYTPSSNKKVISAAERRMTSGNPNRDWQRVVNGERIPSAIDIAVGELLLKKAIESKNATKVVELTAELVEVGTRLGQAVQALSLLKRMDGMSQLVYIQRCVENINKDLAKKFGNKFGEKIAAVKIDEDLAVQLANSSTESDFEISYFAILEDIAAQVPSTFLDKFNSWRYVSMLFNTTTHIRNLLGNAVFIPCLKVKNFIAASMELAFIDSSKKTKALILKKEYRSFGKQDFRNVEDIISGTGKMNPKQGIADNKRIFKNKVLEAVRRSNFELLEKEDTIFLKHHYSEALGGFLQARKVDLKTVPKDALQEARAYAIEEALKATYRDASMVANILSKLSNENAFANILVEGTLPFKKTPINVVKRGVEYSPAGLLKTLGKAVYDLNQGTYTATGFIDGLASNLTGSGVMVIGMLLASLGVVSGGFGEDDEAWFKKLTGEQEYAIIIGDKTYTIDWLAPACIPFFMGVAIAETWDDEDSGSMWQAMAACLGAGLEPIVNLSMLSGIQDTIASIRYSDRDNIIQTLIGNMVGNYFSQLLPTMFGKVANTIDDTRRTQYIDKNSNVPRWLQSAYDTVAKKTPILSMTRQPYINAWGETEETGGVAERFLSNFVSPGYFSEIDKTEVSEELERLAKETGEKTIYPDTAKRYVSFKGYTKQLTRNEYTVYATKKGQMQADYLKEAINSKEYKKLNDEQKIKVISNVYKFANAKAKCALSYSYEELNLLHDGVITEKQYEKLSEKARKALVEEYFLNSHTVAARIERNSGSVIDYYVRRAKE